MLASSVTLGLFSDRFGRLRCVQLSFVISTLANGVAILAHDYYLFSACILLMSYAQVGAANALCTLRKYRLRSTLSAGSLDRRPSSGPVAALR